MGPDGHTASLFPGTEALTEQTRNVIQNFVPKFDTYRITFTYPLINAARHVCFMVEGEDKKPIVDQILAGHAKYPADGVAPADGRLTWILGWAAIDLNLLQPPCPIPASSSSATAPPSSPRRIASPAPPMSPFPMKAATRSAASPSA